MKSHEIRRSFIEYFTAREHRRYASAPLVPHGDATLLFTNAGMVQFKDFFLGRDTPPSPRAVSAQKCMRVSGKHNDLENVGPSPRHHTFFEMLGNFSFGDYFKAEAIEFGWELVTGVWGLAPERLSVTVFEDDEEAASLWRKITGLPAARIHRHDAKDNFWAMGETGPCGPCSEIFVDCHPDLPAVDWEEGTESGRYLEIWNLVFMQFDRDAAGALVPLPRPSIDTGAGLERVAAVLQGVDSNYDTDLFRPLLDGAAALAGRTYGEAAAADVSLRVVADHLRAIAFLLADGVIPGSEGRGYVLRRILRRAARHGQGLGFEEPFLHRLLPLVGETVGAEYRELEGAEQASKATVQAEEEKFLATVAAASRQVQEAIERARRAGSDELSGETVFRLYDTYGLPIEVIREIAEEERIGLEEAGFEAALERQRKRSRQATADGRPALEAIQQAVGETAASGGEPAATEFTGYRRLRLDGARLVGLARLAGGAPAAARCLAAGEAGVAILDRTPFYAEAGGQVGDRGRLTGPAGSAEVTDTRKDAAGVSYHFVTVTRGGLEIGEELVAEVDAAARRATERNHTATHLLHLALRRLLGQSVRQAGSLVAPDRLRFDFTFHSPLPGETLRRLEGLVNGWIRQARETRITADRELQEAVAAGAMALFGEKYDERVRTVEVPALEVPRDDGAAEVTGSLELCGGCHVSNTGEIGLFLITAERGVASGVRRIEALTGEAAERYVASRRELLDAVEGELGVPAERAPEEVARRRERLKAVEQELSETRLRLLSGAPAAEAGQRVEGIEIVAREVPPAPVHELRNMADVLRSRLGSGVVVLASREEDKVSLVAAVSDDLTGRLHAGRLAKAVAARVGGGGGGRADFAQAGGREPGKLPAALAAIGGIVREQLARSAAEPLGKPAKSG